MLEPDGYWPALRDIRLAAAPRIATCIPGHATTRKKLPSGGSDWLSEFSRGNWHVGTIDGKLVALVGITREPETKAHELLPGVVWVAPLR